MKNRLKCVALLSVVMIAGCSSKEIQQDKKFNPMKEMQVSREHATAWDNIGRGGAAMREPAYIHVLGDGDVAATERQTDYGRIQEEKRKNALADDEAIISNAFDNYDAVRRTGAAYSQYELSRWERYCAKGVGMDEADWKFVVQAGGADSIPFDVIPNCIRPNHNSDDYLKAWEKFCTGAKINADEREIVRNSVRPYSKEHPCRSPSRFR